MSKLKIVMIFHGNMDINSHLIESFSRLDAHLVQVECGCNETDDEDLDAMILAKKLDSGVFSILRVMNDSDGCQQRTDLDHFLFPYILSLLIIIHLKCHRDVFLIRRNNTRRDEI